MLSFICHRRHEHLPISIVAVYILVAIVLRVLWKIDQVNKEKNRIKHSVVVADGFGPRGGKVLVVGGGTARIEFVPNLGKSSLEIYSDPGIQIPPQKTPIDIFWYQPSDYEIPPLLEKISLEIPESKFLDKNGIILPFKLKKEMFGELQPYLLIIPALKLPISAFPRDIRIKVTPDEINPGDHECTVNGVTEIFVKQEVGKTKDLRTCWRCGVALRWKTLSRPMKELIWNLSSGYPGGSYRQEVCATFRSSLEKNPTETFGLLMELRPNYRDRVMRTCLEPRGYTMSDNLKAVLRKNKEKFPKVYDEIFQEKLPK